jgi:hypothetical protein
MNKNITDTKHLFHFRRLHRIQDSISDCLKFAVECHDVRAMENYDGIYKILNTEIKKLVMVLTAEEKRILTSNYVRLAKEYKELL